MNKNNQTHFTSEAEVKRERYLVDASGKILGRLATKVAIYLRGKHKPIYTPNSDCGDYIAIINADKVAVSGRKTKQKTYFTHSGYPGGDKLINLEKMMETKPERVIELAITGMVPHTKLGAKILKKLKVFRGEKPEFAKYKKLEV